MICILINLKHSMWNQHESWADREIKSESTLKIDVHGPHKLLQPTCMCGDLLIIAVLFPKLPVAFWHSQEHSSETVPLFTA